MVILCGLFFFFAHWQWRFMDVEVAFVGRNDFQKQIPGLSGGNSKCMALDICN